MIVNSYEEAEPNKKFRLKTDTPNIIRFMYDRSDNFSNQLSRSVRVAGTSYRKEIIKKFVEGKNRKVEVEYSPTKEYPQAIKVFGLWEDKDGFHKEHIGYIEDNEALIIYKIYENLPIEATLWNIYKPYKSKKNFGIRICIWCPINDQKFVRKKGAKL